MTTQQLTFPLAPLVLADLLTPSRARNAALVFAGAMLTVLGAQVSIPVPPSPVPITGQTFAVVVAGAALGAKRGAGSQALYVLIGLFFPVYSDGKEGLDVLWGPTGGYLVGFIVAAWIIGRLAELGADRRPALAIVSFGLAQLAIFGIGVPWLKVSADMTWARAIHDGFTIFLVGGAIKAVCAGLALPAAWRIVGRIDRG